MNNESHSTPKWDERNHQLFQKELNQENPPKKQVNAFIPDMKDLISNPKGNLEHSPSKDQIKALSISMNNELIVSNPKVILLIKLI